MREKERERERGREKEKEKEREKECPEKEFVPKWLTMSFFLLF